MKIALVTGSETFGKYITNPTKWLALSADESTIANYEIHSLIFPSVVAVPEGMEDAGTAIVRKAQSIQAKAIISFGMSSDVHGFRIERSATNWVYNEKYLSQQENNHPLNSAYPDKEQLHIDLSMWDVHKMQTLFKQASVPFDPQISDNAGHYSCNSWMYRTLKAMEVMQVQIPYIFVHTACTQEAIELIPDFDKDHKLLIKKEDTRRALEFVLESLVI